MLRQPLPVGMDNFEKLRSNGYFYVDKTLMIRDFLEMRDEVALICRPRRFGKTLHMTMIREFFDLTKDSRSLFEGLKIMDTPCKNEINSRPVIYFTFKNCKGATVEELMFQLRVSLQEEYSRYGELLEGKLDTKKFSAARFRETYGYVMDSSSPYIYLSTGLLDITRVAADYYQIKPILLIDEYDQPVMSSYEYGYHQQLGAFFSNFYGSAMKGNEALGQALITGVQRVAKESIFSQFNNPKVYTVFSRQYSGYFGLTEEEVSRLLNAYGLELNEDVRRKYDGYQFGDTEIYNPWSILNYADNGFLDNYWVNSSSNYLIRQALSRADKNFWDRFDRLAAGEEVTVWLTLDTAYVERDSNYSLWGLLVNAGYLAVVRRLDAGTAVVRIPNEEVMLEFQTLRKAHAVKGYKVLLFDLDGTLLRSDKTISSRTLSALKTCRERGLLIGVSTSRSEKNSGKFLQELTPDIVISSGGALVNVQGRYICREEFSEEETRDLICSARELCGKDCEITVDTMDSHYWNYKIDPKREDASWGDSIYTDFSDFSQKALKICVEISDPQKASCLAGRYPDWDCVRFSDGDWYKFTRKSATKEGAILDISRELGISPKEIIAFGDDLVDIGMLKLCGLGIAMGNGLEQVKQEADLVIGGNDQEGIGIFLEELLDE